MTWRNKGYRLIDFLLVLIIAVVIVYLICCYIYKFVKCLLYAIT